VVKIVLDKRKEGHYINYKLGGSMSRTYMHRPLKFDYDWRTDEPWRYEYRKRFNEKGPQQAREDRRRIRHAPIDEEEVALTNALAQYKSDIFARDKNW